MKRSEMIDKLDRYIVDKSGDVGSDEILNMMEDLGMVPPPIGSGAYDNYGYELEIYDWEDEDEKK